MAEYHRRVNGKRWRVDQPKEINEVWSKYNSHSSEDSLKSCAKYE